MWSVISAPPPDRRAEARGGFGVVGPDPHLWSSQMDRLFNKKSKKLLKPSQRHASLGIPTNIAAGPLGFRAELDIDPKGEQVRSYHGLADRPDSAVMMPDENDTRASRIVLCHDNKSEDHGPPSTPELSTTGTVVGGDEYRNDPTSE